MNIPSKYLESINKKYPGQEGLPHLLLAILEGGSIQKCKYNLIMSFIDNLPFSIEELMEIYKEKGFDYLLDKIIENNTTKAKQ